MRTTVTLDAEVAAAVDELRRKRGLGVSAALNELSKRGLAAKADKPAFVQETSPMGVRIDVSNVAEALEKLDEL